jgi:hypothetical protein
MKSPGATIPRAGCFQRKRASTLIVEHELVGLYCLAEVFLQRSAGIGDNLQCWGKKANGVAARHLSLMHSNFGLLQDFICAFRISPEDGDADAGGFVEFAAGEQKWLADGSEDLLGDVLCLGRGIFRGTAQVFEHHYKLISAQSSHGVGFANARDETPGDFLQQKVARLMAKDVVQRPEVVDINEQQCSLAPADAGGRSLAQPIQQQAAVGKMC